MGFANPIDVGREDLLFRAFDVDLDREREEIPLMRVKNLVDGNAVDLQAGGFLAGGRVGPEIPSSRGLRRRASASQSMRSRREEQGRQAARRRYASAARSSTVRVRSVALEKPGRVHFPLDWA